MTTLKTDPKISMDHTNLDIPAHSTLLADKWVVLFQSKANFKTKLNRSIKPTKLVLVRILGLETKIMNPKIFCITFENRH